MSHEIRLSWGGNFIYLVGPSAQYCSIETYAPQSPALDEMVSSSPFLADGAEQVTAYRNTAETMDLFLQHSSKANLQALIWELDRYLSLAAIRQRSGMGDRVYLEYKPDGDTVWWRSEILGGRFALDREGSMRAWAGNQAEGLLSITRRYFWEGTLTSLSMTSSVEGTPDTEVTIYNNDDANSAQTNWVHIASDQVLGSLPTPAKLTLTSQEATGQDWKDIFVAHNVINDPATFDHWVLGSGAVNGDARSWTGAQTAGYAAYEWRLTTAQVQDTRGAFVRLLWCGSCSTGTWMQARVGVGVDPTGTRSIVWSGDLVPIASSSSKVWDLGALPLPPGGYGTAYDYVSVYVYVYSTGSGSATCDCMMLGPASTSFRKIKQHGFSIEQGDALIDDAVEGKLYVLEASTGKAFPIYSAMSAPLMLWPGVVQRFYVLIAQDTWSAGAGKILTVKAAYRPRKLSV